MQIDIRTLFNLTFEKLIKSEEEALKYSRNAVKIVPAKLEENLGDYAALSLAADNH